MLFVIKNWKAIGLLIGCVSLFVFGYYTGTTFEEIKRLKAEKEFKDAQTVLVIELEKARDDLAKATSKGVRTIYVEKDPTGCSDTTIPDGVRSILQAADNTRIDR